MRVLERIAVARRSSALFCRNPRGMQRDGWSCRRHPELPMSVRRGVPLWLCDKGLREI